VALFIFILKQFNDDSPFVNIPLHFTLDFQTHPGKGKDHTEKV